MAQPRHHRGFIGPQFLAARGLEVNVARARLRAALDRAPRRSDAQPLRDDLLAALERLAAEVARSGAPLPYRIHAEIELYRRLQQRT